MAKAEELFASKGYHYTSVDEIVKAANTGKGSFYWYWTSKEELLKEIIETRFNSYIQTISEELSADTSTAEKLTGIIIRGGNMLPEYRMLCKLVCSIAGSDESVFDPELMQIIQQSYAKIQGLLEQVLKQGQEEGIINDQLPVKEMAMLMLSLAVGALFQERIHGTPTNYAELSPIVLTVFTQGVLKQDD